jgi:hypothetical protein
VCGGGGFLCVHPIQLIHCVCQPLNKVQRAQLEQRWVTLKVASATGGHGVCRVADRTTVLYSTVDTVS